MPPYNPYILQLPSSKSSAWETVSIIIGYAVAVLVPCLSRKDYCSKEEITKILKNPSPGTVPESLEDLAGTKIATQDTSKMLNDLRRLGIIDVYYIRDVGESYISPSESKWPSNAVARLGANAAAAYTALRRCLTRGVEPKTCLQLAAAVAAVRFLYVGGGSSKLRELVRSIFKGRTTVEDSVKKLGTLGEANVKQKLDATISFFKEALGFIRRVTAREPGLVSRSYLTLIKELATWEDGEGAE